MIGIIGAVISFVISPQAVSGKRYDPVIIDFCNRIEATGKNKMVALGGLMLRVMHIVYGVLKSGKPFNVTLHLWET